jgi:hypothetical protein
MLQRNNGFLLDSFQNTSLASHQETFLQNTCSNSNCFFLFPMCASSLLENDIGVHKFGGLVGRFVTREYFCQIFYMF